jgi:hypothetical protein
MSSPFFHYDVMLLFVITRCKRDFVLVGNYLRELVFVVKKNSTDDRLLKVECSRTLTLVIMLFLLRHGLLRLMIKFLVVVALWEKGSHQNVLGSREQQYYL